LKRKRFGLCTKWLFDIASHPQNETIPFYIKKGSFPNVTLEDSILIIATGTGIAPIRSFLWDRFYQFKQKEENANVGRTVFFYGCRKKDFDYFYGEENELFECESEFK
jgi:NADPH-ferrihemoprotein reductase